MDTAAAKKRIKAACEKKLNSFPSWDPGGSLQSLSGGAGTDGGNGIGRGV